MAPSSANSPEHEAEGIIQVLDPLSRELVVLTRSKPITFYVPLGCSIILNDERVKLRMLQPMDRAIVRYSQDQGSLAAHSILVNWSSHTEEIDAAATASRPIVGLMECT